MEELHLEKVTWDNVDAILNLHVNKEQRSFAAKNKDSLVHACLAMADEGKQAFPFGVYKAKRRLGSS